MKFGSNVLVGIFNDRYQAELAYDELKQAGFATEDLGFALRGSDAIEGGMITDALGTKDGEGAAVGAATGAVAGGVFGAIAAMLVPGIGPVLSAGILWTAMGFGAAGAAVGGLVGAMTGLGISEDEAVYYEQEFNSGKALIAVRTGMVTDQALEIIRRHGGYFVGDQLPPSGGAQIVGTVAPA
jgi:hypothetical protein